jgi:hypothetical protein
MIKSKIFDLKLLAAAMLVFSILPCALRAEDTIWNRVFFLDFQNIGAAVIEDPLKISVIAAGFGASTYLLMKNDLWLSKSLRSCPNKFKDGLFNFFNCGGDGLTVLAGDSLFFAVGGEKEKRTAQSIVEGLAVSGAITNLIKISCGRKRPSQTDNPLEFKGFTFSDASYPSGHTSTAFLCATIIGDRYDIGWITYPAASLTGLARIYKSAHWPSDVLLGAVIGIVAGKVINDVDKRDGIVMAPAADGFSLSYRF